MLTAEERYLPITITVPGMTDEKFRELCERYEDYFLECSADGEVTISAPRDPETGVRNAEISAQLWNWMKAHGTGYTVASSTGFLLPSVARRSADAAWILTLDRCPEFVVELIAPGDRLGRIRGKMEWIEAGAKLGWMIDPSSRTVAIYRPCQEPEERVGLTEIGGEGPVQGLELDLGPVWGLARV